MTSLPVYQLKWGSHSSNLNSSVLNLFRNEKYSDVLLMTSHPAETPAAIYAHKVILSSCSHYFSSIFDNTPGPSPNAIIYVILPPDLTKRALEILVQYIYCGEATVSNDVLNEVLAGGELLKIRGLWRNSSTDYIDSQQPQQHYQRSYQALIPSQTAPHPHPPPPPASHLHPGPVAHHHLAGPSNGREARIQIASFERERPVIIRTTENRSPARDPVINGNSNSAGPSGSSNYYPTPSVYVKKNLGRVVAPVEPVEDCETCRITMQNKNEANNSSSNSNDVYQSSQMPKKETGVFYANKRSSDDMESNINNSLRPSINRSINHELPNEDRNGTYSNEVCPPSANSNIKQEPQDWEEYEQKPEVANLASSVKRELVYNEEATETGDGSGGEEASSNCGPMFTPLSCELCKEIFTVPADWVRHIENHAETPQTVPKKRRRTEEINDNMASLKCDLCSMYFQNPADWVRHIQKTHTETELAVSNTLAKASSISSHSVDPHLVDQNCVVCTKPTYSSEGSAAQSSSC